MERNAKKPKNGTRIVLTLLAMLLTLLAIGSHVLPMAADGVRILTGLDYLKIADSLDFPLLAIPVSLVVSVSGFLFALTGLIRKKALIGTCICAVVSAALLAYGVKGDIATAGVIAFFDFHVFAVACAIAAMNVKPRKKKETAAVPVVEAPVSNTCPACGKPQEAGSAFCGFCGTAFAPAQPEPEFVPEPEPVFAPEPEPVFAPEPEPVFVPAPVAAPKPAQLRTCANCGAELEDGAAFCGCCGTPVAPAQPKTPAAPAVCANCGAAVVPGGKFCLVCGTLVAAAPVVRNTCRNCGAELEPGAAFCGACGTPAR